jgi:ribosomal protection tetracycline resistance protein
MKSNTDKGHYIQLMQRNENIRNVGIVAHVDAGKTTITEQMLYLSGEIRAPGSVDRGTAHTDWLEVERARGISVRAASTTFSYGGVSVNLLDTPGHVDFASEVERSLWVLDGAVLVVPAVEGVQTQAELLWRALRSLNIPTLVFINKLDRVGADEARVLEDLKRRLSPRMLPLQWVERSETGFSIEGLLEPEPDAAAPYCVVSSLTEVDDALLEKYLAGETITCRMACDAMKNAVENCSLFPVIYGSALKGAGVRELIESVIRYLPAPVADEAALPSGIVYRIEHDKTMGKVAHVRLFGGTLANRDTVTLASGETAGKVSQIRRVYANRWKDIGALTAGDIAAVCGLGSVKVGDLLGEATALRAGVPLAVPLLRVQALPANEDEYPRLMEALGELAEEDPAIDLQWMKDERELRISIMGGIQLEVLQSLLMERYGLSVTFGKPSVIYKETPASHGFGHVSYTMPKPCWAILDFEIEPLPRGSGLQYSSVVRDDRVFYRYQEHVRKTVPESLKQGMYGWEVTDLKVTLVDGEHHIWHTHPMDFFTATPMGIMDGLRNCGTTLLEPMLNIRIAAPEEFAGKFIRDVLEMRGSFESPAMHGGSLTMEALVPVATSLDYAARLGAMTSGKGAISASFAGYRECPLELGATTPYRGVNPLDTANYILKIRGALK